MRKATGIVATALMAGALWTGGSHAALAQEASPIAVDPAECVVEPRTVDELVIIFTSGDYAPDPAIASGNFPQGTPASDDVVVGVNATLRQVIACGNANDFQRMLALLTDNGAQFFGPEESDATDEQIRTFFASMEPTPAPVDERDLFSPLTDVVVLEDGRVGGLSADPSGEDTSVYLIFANVDGLWLIDQIVEVTGAATPVATPAA